MQRAQVVKLDRGYPLVRCEDGRLVRCEHATALVKGEKVRAVIGDFVEVNAPEGHDKGIIESICPRERAFVRKDPTERAVPQVLAANFDRVILAQPLAEVNLRRLERELVLAYETGAAVTVVLTSAGYPGSYEKGKVITGVEDAEAMDDVTVYHAGTALTDAGELVTSGGRVLDVTALGDTFEAARDRAYAACEKIQFEGKTLRHDIGLRALRGRAAWDE